MSKGQRLRTAPRTKTPPPVGKTQQSARRPWIGGGAILAAAAIAGIAIAGTHSSKTSPAKPVDEGALPALQSGPAPWSTAVAGLADRLEVLGLPALTQEGTVVHIHQHLDVFVAGKRVTVPAGIGIDDDSFLAPIHTHDASGVIHVESPTKEHFTLGQVFAVWGVRFGRGRVGGYRASTRSPIRVYVDGKRLRGDPARLVLASHQQIAVVIGKRPAGIPATYPFPAGL